MGQILSDVTEVLNYQDSKKEADTKRKQILRDMSIDEENKTNLIKKALATQRAKYGAEGVNGANMTTGAVLKRIQDETAEPYDKKRNTNLAKLKSVKQKDATSLLKRLLKHFDDLVG
ncbi:MAG: hypothetical protein J5679_02745 [Alphaproteobacteria bacterium]|nr:hypothetical protein [Alphaproteobacteria bacterium]